MIVHPAGKIKYMCKYIRNTGPEALKIQHYTHKYYRCSQILPDREKVNRTVHWTELLLKIYGKRSVKSSSNRL